MAGLTDYFNLRNKNVYETDSNKDTYDYDDYLNKYTWINPQTGKSEVLYNSPVSQSKGVTPAVTPPPTTPPNGSLVGKIGDFFTNFKGYFGGDKSGDGTAGNTSDGTAGNTSGGTAGDIYQQKMTLAERLAAEQRRLAETASQYKRDSLADQLEAQRRQYMQQLASMNEQMYGQGNRLIEGLANRGLATSGLLQLGGVQSQMAKGQGLSELAYQDRIGREGIATEQRQVEGDLFSALRQAELDKAGTEIDALTQKYNMEQSEKSQQEQKAYNMLSVITDAYAIINDPNTSQATKDQLIPLIQAAALGDVTKLEQALKGQNTTEGGTKGGGGVLTDFLNTSNNSAVGDVAYPTFMSNVLNQQATLKTSTGQVIDMIPFIDKEDYSVKHLSFKYKATEANDFIKGKYKGFDNYDNITVQLVDPKNPYGLQNKPFGVQTPAGMKWFKTWNAASEFYNTQNS